MKDCVNCENSLDNTILHSYETGLKRLREIQGVVERVQLAANTRKSQLHGRNVSTRRPTSARVRMFSLDYSLR